MINQMNDSQKVAITLQWIQGVVVELNLCPFAKAVLEREALDILPLSGTDEENLMALVQQLLYLRNTDSMETVFLLLPDAQAKFEQFLDFADLANTLLMEQGFDGEFQLATFHPDYRFADAPDNDAANYTNRSPWPMLQILRESSVEQAVAGHPDIDSIPQRNIEVTRQLGQTAVHDMRQATLVLSAEASSLLK